jgi:hypothetical protein
LSECYENESSNHRAGRWTRNDVGGDGREFEIAENASLSVCGGL